MVLVFEDFGGESLKYWLTHQSFTLEEFLRLAIDMVACLAHLHAIGIAHKNLTADNFVWNPATGQVKIIGFGMASGPLGEKVTPKGPQLLKNAPYLFCSPEQTGRMNRYVDWRSDLYSLGVIFFYMLTGRMPFDSEEPQIFLSSLVNENPKSICQFRSGVPSMLSCVMRKLMAKNAEDRYQSALGVKMDLEKILYQLVNADEEETLAQNDFASFFCVPQKLYARQEEVDTLLQAYQRVSVGAVEVVFIAGHSGVGKSTLMGELYKPITKTQGYFATGQFAQFQHDVPFSAIIQAFDGFCYYLLTEETPKRLEQWRELIFNEVGAGWPALLKIMPQLKSIIDSELTPVQIDDPKEAKEHFRFIFNKLLKAICQPDHPFVLFLDNLQWADPSSLVLLKDLLDYKEGHLLVVCAYRNNEVDATSRLLRTIADLQSQTIVNTITLSNLPLNSVECLIGYLSFQC